MQRPLAHDVPRHGAPTKWPAGAAPPGGAVLLVDEHTSSDGDVLAWAFQRLQLGSVVGQRTWGGVDGIEDELGPCDSHSPTCKCNLPSSEVCKGLPFCTLDHVHVVHTRCCGPACQTLRLASCEVYLRAMDLGAAAHVEGGAASGAASAAAAAADGYAATISVYLEAAAFDLDARLDAGPARADFSAEQPAHAFELVLRKVRPSRQPQSRRNSARPGSRQRPSPSVSASF